MRIKFKVTPSLTQAHAMTLVQFRPSKATVKRGQQKLSTHFATLL